MEENSENSDQPSDSEKADLASESEKTDQQNLPNDFEEQSEEGVGEEIREHEENNGFKEKINMILESLSKLPDSVEEITIPLVIKEPILVYSKLCKALKIPESSEFLSNVNEESMDFSYHNLGPVGIIAVTKSLTYCTSVKMLNLSFNELGSGSLPAVTSLLNQNEFINNLNLSHNNIGTNCTKQLSDLIAVCSFITHLDLSGNHLAGDELGSIAESLANMNSLKSLNLSKNDIGASSGDLFGSNIAKCSELEELDLSDNHLAEGISKIFRSLKNSNLRVLSVSKNGISDEAMQDAAFGIRSSKSLQELDFSLNFVTTKGAPTLASGIKKSSSLQILKLAYNPIEDKGADILIRSIGNSLQLLDISGTKVGLSFLKAYRNKRKTAQELKIIFGSEIRYSCLKRDHFTLEIEEDLIDKKNALRVAQALADDRGVSLRNVFKNIHASFLAEQADLIEADAETETEEDTSKIIRKMTAKDFAARLSDSALEVPKSLALKLSMALSDSLEFVDMWEVIPKVIYRPDDLTAKIKVEKKEPEDKKSKKKKKDKKKK